MKEGNRGDMRKNPRDTAVFRGWPPSGLLFRKNKKLVLDVV